MSSTALSTSLARLPVRLTAAVWRFAVDRSATTAIEYALMTFIAVAVIVAVTSLGGTVNGMYEQVKNIFVN
jgi:Flp pilus assembly pilin Flp